MKTKIKRFLRSGEICTEGIEDIDDLLNHCGRMLDKAYSHDILGEVVFEDEDGKFYLAEVIAVISDPEPSYLKGILEEDEKEKK